MLYFFRIVVLLINIDQKTILNWIGFEEIKNNSNIDLSSNVSIETFRLLLENLWEKIQNGLTLSEIENVLFFILFLRFIILIFRYNIKTSFYITCIGLFAGYLWYRHLIDLILMYRNVLINIPFLHSLGTDAIQIRNMNKQLAITDVKLGENAHWYNPGQILYAAFNKGIMNIDNETGLKYYIDPFSMIISNLKEPYKSKVFPFYYKLYTKLIPKFIAMLGKFWNQLSGIAAYAIITRIGKRYCPYLIRWHWTFLLIIGLVEQIFIYFIYRAYYFQSFVLVAQKKESLGDVDPNLIFQINIVSVLIATVVLLHIGFIIFGLFHAIWGQYFYIPFFVENTELHIGPRPKASIYSGGQTAWQESEEKNSKRLIPKLWFGWFGRGTKTNILFRIIPNLEKIIKNVKKLFQK